MKMIGNVSDWLSYAGGALIKVANSAGSTVPNILILSLNLLNQPKCHFDLPHEFPGNLIVLIIHLHAPPDITKLLSIADFVNVCSREKA